MAHPLVWPGRYFFYPIGNTPAVCLTRDLGPDEPANILLLGCGDPRNILYTIFCEPQTMNRKIDFTCCDKEPAVLARNILLMTMVADKQYPTAVIWNIFFHMYLDEGSHTALVEQCRKLIELSDTPQHWSTSVYGPFLKMCTEYTLVEVRRHWSLYANMQDLPPQRTKIIRDAFTAKSKYALESTELIATPGPAMSSGPLVMRAMQVSSDHYKEYWKTGLTFSDPTQIIAATRINPTFVYSLAGEGCAVHYATDPLISFHFAATFGNAKGAVTISDIVKAAKTQFGIWCLAFQTSVSPDISNVPAIRFFLGEATAVCQAFRGFATTKTLNLGVPVAPWKTQLIQLCKDEYIKEKAPSSFNVIETSNLVDHIGLLNILIATVPLLSRPAPSSVLYTESMLAHGMDATKHFKERLYANITVIGLLLGLCPVDYLTGFNTQSNSHDLMTLSAFKAKPGSSRQFHQTTTWKSPASGDAVVVQDGAKVEPLIFDPRQLGTFFYDVYHQLFEQEDTRHFIRLNQANFASATARANIVHYIRESYVLLLKVIKEHIGISREQWVEVMDRFFALQGADQSLPMDTVNAHDLWAQLHRHGLYTVSHYQGPTPKIGRFANWDAVPTLVRIILVVPRDKLVPLQKYLDKNGTPSLQCNIMGIWSHNIFSAIHVAFGRVTSFGTQASPRVIFHEDPDGWKGSMPLIASFTAPSKLLTDIEPQKQLNINLFVRSTAATFDLSKELGISHNIFSAKFLDLDLVHVLPEQPLPSRKYPASSPTSPPVSYGLFTQIGKSHDTSVELDEECEVIASLKSGFSVEDEKVKHLFGVEKVAPQVTQLSPCVMRVTIGSYTQDVRYPFPVMGSQHKLLLARKSLYVELILPVAGTFQPDGMNVNPYPVVRVNSVMNPWSIHRVILSRMPILDMKAKKINEWLTPHVGSMMSARERSIKKKKRQDGLMFVKNTLQTIFVWSSGIQDGQIKRLFSLHDKLTHNCDTVLFVSDLRFDLHSHTMVCDAFVLPLTRALLLKIGSVFNKLVGKGDMVQLALLEGEIRSWKQLLPAFVERCRSSWKHGVNCEYKSQGRIPLTEDMEVDPLCSCGQGKDVEGMSKVALWKELAPYVTRIALSPLFGVSYLEAIGRDPAHRRCFVCRAKGNPKLKKCTGCEKVRYCSEACQKKDWKIHKKQCNLKV